MKKISNNEQVKKVLHAATPEEISKDRFQNWAAQLDALKKTPVICIGTDENGATTLLGAPGMPIENIVVTLNLVASQILAKKIYDDRQHKNILIAPVPGIS